MLAFVLVQLGTEPALVLKVIPFTGAPAQTVWLFPPPPELMDIVGVGLTITFTESLAVQPLASVPLTVYSVVTLGLANTGVPYALLKLPEGVQV